MGLNEKSKRQRDAFVNSGFIVTFAPEAIGRHPYSFRLSRKFIRVSLVGVLGLLIGFFLVGFLWLGQYRAHSALQVKVNSIVQGAELADSVGAGLPEELDAMAIAFAQFRNDNAYLLNKLEQTELELSASEASLLEMRVSMQGLLGQLELVDALSLELQVLAGVEPGLKLDVARGDAGGPAEIDSFEGLTTDLNVLVGEAKTNLAGLDTVISEVRDSVVEQQAKAGAIPRIWPVEGFISSNFGWRRSPLTGRENLHRGLDIAALKGTPVVVPAAARVVEAGWSDEGYGNRVLLDHGYGLKTLYAHLHVVSVEAGATLELGDELGLVGSTGYSTGPHLHYEVWLDDVQVNPHSYLP